MDNCGYGYYTASLKLILHMVILTNKDVEGQTRRQGPNYTSFHIDLAEVLRSITAKKINEKTDTTEDRINRGKRPIEGDREAHTAKQSASGEGEREVGFEFQPDDDVE